MLTTRRSGKLSSTIRVFLICCLILHIADAAFMSLGDQRNQYVECCPIGYKKEVRLNEEGKEIIYNHCKVSNCCMGLKEILKLGSNGLTYAMCVMDETRSMRDLKGLAILAKLLKRYYGDEPMQKKRRTELIPDDY